MVLAPIESKSVFQARLKHCFLFCLPHPLCNCSHPPVDQRFGYTLECQDTGCHRANSTYPPVSLRSSGDACPALVSKISTVFWIHSFIITTNIYSASCHGQSSISGSQGSTELNPTLIFPFRMLLGSPEAYGRFFSVRETGMCLRL